VIKMRINEHERYFSYDSHDGPVMLFTTRRGGVSPGPYSSLNMGYSTRDSKDNVYGNREIVVSEFGLTLGDMVTSDQVHGVDLVEAGRKNMNAGRCDGIFTREKGIVLSMYFADCVPLFFFDAKKRVAGLVHAGWRGTRGDIARGAVRFMRERYASSPGDILAVVGPSIGSCCFEVGGEVEASFEEGLPENFLRGNIRRSEAEAGKFFIDLKRINAMLLQQAGIGKENITVHEICTSCEKKVFFSYRRDSGDTGRMAGLVFLK